MRSDEVPELERRFQQLLQSRGLQSAAKAISLRTDFPNTFCDSKILTDLRPVFGDDAQRPPSAAIITHTLKIDYHGTNRKHQEFYVTLDADDLNTLASAIQRARQKASSLRGLLNRAGTVDLDMPVGETEG